MNDAFPLVRIVAAILTAMEKATFFRERGERTTAREASRVLLDDEEIVRGSEAKATEILAWARQTDPYRSMPQDTDELTLEAYGTLDPGFRLAQAYREAGYPALGRFYDGGEIVVLTCFRVKMDYCILPSGNSFRQVARNTYVFGDAFGSRFEWITTSDTFDATPMPGDIFAARFEVRRKSFLGVRAMHRIMDLKILDEA